MAFQVKVKVLRHQNGDDEKGNPKSFKPGDYRSLSVADAERLAETGAVEIVGKPANKANRQAPKNKAVKTAPKNKGK